MAVLPRGRIAVAWALRHPLGTWRMALSLVLESMPTAQCLSALLLLQYSVHQCLFGSSLKSIACVWLLCMDSHTHTGSSLCERKVLG